MATITAVEATIISGKSATITWETMGDDDTGTTVDVSDFSDRCVTATGTFGGSVVVTIQGSNDNTTFVTVQDSDNANITFSAAGVSTIHNNTRFLRAVTSGGTSADVDVIIHASK